MEAAAGIPAAMAEHIEAEAGVRIEVAVVGRIAAEAAANIEEPLHLRSVCRNYHRIWRYPDFVYHSCYKT
jgi:antitoxin component of MazEF toxin-antitoxin module